MLQLKCDYQDTTFYKQVEDKVESVVLYQPSVTVWSHSIYIYIHRISQNIYKSGKPRQIHIVPRPIRIRRSVSSSNYQMVFCSCVRSIIRLSRHLHLPGHPCHICSSMHLVLSSSFVFCICMFFHLYIFILGLYVYTSVRMSGHSPTPALISLIEDFEGRKYI